MKSSLSNFLNSISSQNGAAPLDLASLLAQTGPQGGAALLNQPTNGTGALSDMNPQDLQDLLAQIQQGNSDLSVAPTGDSAPGQQVDDGSSSDILQGGTSNDDISSSGLADAVGASRVGSSDPDSLNNPVNQIALQSLLNGGDSNAMSSTPTPDAAMPPSADTVPAAPQSLNDALTNMASGKGNVDYSALQAAYPRSQTLPVQSLQDLASQYAPHANESPGSASIHAHQYAQAAQRQEQAQTLAQQNHDNVAAYQAAFSAATESGKTQNEAAKVAEEVVRDKNIAQYQQGEIGLRNRYADAMMAKATRDNAKLVPMADGSMGLYDAAHSEKGVTPLPGTKSKLSDVLSKPLPAAQQNEVKSSLNDYFTDLDDNNKKVPIAIDPTQKNLITQEAFKRYAAGKAPDGSPIRDGATAVGSVMNDLNPKGKDLSDLLVPQTKPGKLWGTNPTGKVQFPNSLMNAISGGATQTPVTLSAAQNTSAANPNSAAPAIATVKSDVDFNALPSGAIFTGPDGKMRKKP